MKVATNRPSNKRKPELRGAFYGLDLSHERGQNRPDLRGFNRTAGSAAAAQEEESMANLQALADAVKSGNRAEAVKQTKQAIEEKVSPGDILNSMVGAMDEIGRRFQRNEVFVPEMLIASRAMKESMAVLEPLLVKAGIKPAFTAVVGTVQGDLHDIGKNLVAMMWKGANFGVVDLGTNVAPEKFLAAAKEHNAKVVGLSALLTTTMPAMKQTVQTLKSAGLPGLKVLVGGAPITHEFAKEIGADGFAPDAASAVDLVRKLVVA
jgi:5-methyltetrahydrofolate--homocysteine methyltransferase